MTKPVARPTALLTGVLLVASLPIVAQRPPTDEAWIGRSNAYATILLRVMARLSPESSADRGIEGLDEAVSDISPGYEARAHAAITDRRRARSSAGGAEAAAHGRASRRSAFLRTIRL